LVPYYIKYKIFRLKKSDSYTKTICDFS